MGAPSLTYAQLFSFQVAYRNVEGQEVSEWEQVVMEVNFSLGKILLLDRERVLVAQPFNLLLKCACNKSDPDDTFMSISTRCGGWELQVQNSAEKACLLHLLKSIRKGVTAEEAVQDGYRKGIVGLDRRVIKFGVILRKAKPRKQRIERFVVVVPGKLYMFSGSSIRGRHVRLVTSLFQASVKMSYTQLEFQIVPHHSKEQDMGSWITALEESIRSANEVTSGKQQSEEYTEDYGAEYVPAASPSDVEQQQQQASEQQRVSLSRQRLNNAIGDMTDVIGRLNETVSKQHRDRDLRDDFRDAWRMHSSKLPLLEQHRGLDIFDRVL